MKHNAKVLGLLAEMMVLILALAGCQGNPPAVVGPHVNVDVDGVWGIPEQGTDKQGANCDRWASGPGGSPSAISDTDPDIRRILGGLANVSRGIGSLRTHCGDAHGVNMDRRFSGLSGLFFF